MPHFVDDNTDLPDGKADAAPRKGAIENSVTAAEWNEAMQAMYDLRDRVMTGVDQTFYGVKTFEDDVHVERLIAAGEISGQVLTLDLEGTVTPGDFTTDKFGGRCQLASGQSEIVITLPGVGVSDNAFAIMAESDATATQIIRAETTADTITITANAAATGNPRVNWFIVRDLG